MELVHPQSQYLASYVDALKRGWSADNVRGVAAAEEELARIAEDAAGFLAEMDDREAKGPPIQLPDGSRVARLPGFRRWLWDGEFCGSIGLRWQQGTPELPPHCPGHIGYAVVPWKQGRGYATAALREMLAEARSIGLPYVELTTDTDNVASQKTILKCGGKLIEHFDTPGQHGSDASMRFRIAVIDGHTLEGGR